MTMDELNHVLTIVAINRVTTTIEQILVMTQAILAQEIKETHGLSPNAIIRRITTATGTPIADPMGQTLQAHVIQETPAAQVEVGRMTINHLVLHLAVEETN